MKEQQTLSNKAASPADSEKSELQKTAVRQQREIADLKAENLASGNENRDLREAARLDQITIENFKQAQRQIEVLNRSLQSRNRALEAVNKELEAFAYTVSHDLRSPLRSIHGFGEALQRSAAAKLSPEESKWLQKVLDAAARMDRLTEDLLRLSRITRSQLKREVVNLAQVAREVVHELRQTDPQRDIAFAISDSLEVQADPALMRVALGNLLENAWKYTGRRPQALVSFGRQQRDGQTVFCVRDNGAGFDMAYAAKLFAPFQRLHSAREFSGSGVGLACVARIIHKHGGRIWADGKTGEGAAFFFTLPDQPLLVEDGEPAE